MQMDNNGSKTGVMPQRNGADAGAPQNTCPIASLTDSRAFLSCRYFVKDYIERHAHPLNAVLHVLGVPMAFAGFFYFLSGRDFQKGAALIFLGYLFQYLGHRAQGNEVGEVTLLKSLYRKLAKRP